MRITLRIHRLPARPNRSTPGASTTLESNRLPPSVSLPQGTLPRRPRLFLLVDELQRAKISLEHWVWKERGVVAGVDPPPRARWTARSNPNEGRRWWCGCLYDRSWWRGGIVESFARSQVGSSNRSRGTSATLNRYVALRRKPKQDPLGRRIRKDQPTIVKWQMRTTTVPCLLF